MRALRTILLLAPLYSSGCGVASPGQGADAWDVTQPRGETREIDFTTDEGTFMSMDVSPDGRWLVFDLLGHVYRLGVEGGEAESLTQASGIALNFHPAISPDGRRIAFISDRGGQNNVWVMDADGSGARIVLEDPETRFVDPEWAPDGRSIVAVRLWRTPGRGWHRQTATLWRLPLDGGEPKQLLGGTLTHYDAPSFSPDGGRLYYHVSYSTQNGNGLLTTGHRIQRLDLAAGVAENVRSDAPTELDSAFVAALARTGYAADVEGDAPAALTPEVSPDGRWLAFAREQPGELFEWRGHRFGPRTALYVRDLETGEERVLVDPVTKDLTQVNAQYGYRPFPGYAWFPDGRSILITRDGRIQRVDVATGDVAEIPFRARVRRTISGQVRGRVAIQDEAFDVRFIQWPAASPAGDRLAFVAAGRAWIMELPAGPPRLAAPGLEAGVQLTPAWSPDGSRLAFTTWDDNERGHVWTVPATGGEAWRVTAEPGEFLHPAWSPDGSEIVVTRGPGPQPPLTWNGWDRPTGWVAVALPVPGGPAAAGGSAAGSTAAGQAGPAAAVEPRQVAELRGLQKTYFGPGGRLYYAFVPDPLAQPKLRWPFPPEDALAQQQFVRSVAGGEARDHLRLPPRLVENEPVLSPDGRWVAFGGSANVWVAAVPEGAVDGVAGAADAAAAGWEPTVPLVDSNPNVEVPGRVRVSDPGGAYHSWLDATTLQYASGNSYVRYDVETGAKDSLEVRLRLPRDVPGADRSIALTGAKLVTLARGAAGGGVIERGTVVVRGARIACVGACETAGVDQVIDASGTTIIPGLIDVHAHHTVEGSGVVPRYRPAYLEDLAYGVTTIVDPATTSRSAFPLAEMVEAGMVPGPRTYSVAEFVISHGTAWGDQRELHTFDDALDHVARRADWGAVSIKNYRLTNRRQQQYLLQAAREVGITVTSEGGPLTFDVGLAMDGQTGWEHLLAVLPVYDDAAQFFGRAGMVYSPTVIVAGHVNGAKEYYRPRQELLRDERYLRFYPEAALVARTRNDRPVPLTEVSFPMVAEGLADIVRAGGYGAIGEHGEQPGIGSHWEIWAYAEALTPLEALKVATWDGAYFIGLEAETGSIEVGKLADLVVLNADPLADVRNTADVRYTMKGGVLWDASTLERLWPERRPLGELPWARREYRAGP